MSTKRKDPRVRGEADGNRRWDVLRNPDPTKAYVYVDPNSAEFGIEFYESLGATVVHRQEGGVRPAVKRANEEGDVYTVLGCVLMEMPKEVKAEIATYGVGGQGGQQLVDRIEKQILKPGGIDALRGLGQGLSVTNETERNKYETRSA